MNGGNYFVRKCIEGWRAKVEALRECLNKLFKLWDGDGRPHKRKTFQSLVSTRVCSIGLVFLVRVPLARVCASEETRKP